jgi:EAL domain-containing protein (putative c-di-GMP-specific phosphodiesterase class I)
VDAEAVNRAADVAMSAENARDTVASTLPDDADRGDASRAAHAVAETVAADVVARATATESAAALVAAAVTAAADTAFVAAQSAAATVELAAAMAAASGRVVATSSGATEDAANVAVRSATRVADLAPRLRAVAALRRVSLAPHPMVAELTGALARAELLLHYQPIYHMQTGALAAVEALLRWQHPLRGLLTPAAFLDLAEAHPDLVTPVGDWVLTTAVAEAQTWRRSLGAAAPKMWVNISCDQLGTSHVPALVERLLSTAGLPPSALGMEVTERQLVVLAGEAGQDLLDLRDLGISLAIDDFGTGYASLDYLRWQTFDEIKIDRSFVAGLGRDRTDTAVTSSIIALAQSLDLNVVAEGVETQDQYDRLEQLGCAMSQGYFLHRPAPPEVIGRLLGVPPDGDAV